MAAKKQRHVSPHVAEYPPGHWSNCLRVGDVAYVSGMTSRAADLKTIDGANAYKQLAGVWMMSSRSPSS